MYKSNNNRILIIGVSNCGQTILFNIILSQKHCEVPIITKSKNQHPQKDKNISVEVQSLNKYENSTVVFDDMLQSEEETKKDLFLTRGRHTKTDILLQFSKLFSTTKNYFSQ